MADRSRFVPLSARCNGAAPAESCPLGDQSFSGYGLLADARRLALVFVVIVFAYSPVIAIAQPEPVDPPAHEEKSAEALQDNENAAAAPTTQPAAEPTTQPATERRGRRRPPQPEGQSSTTVIAEGRILTMDKSNTVMNSGTLTIRDGKIATIAEGGGMGGPGAGRANRIDAKGRYVTPGLIDAWSAVGMSPGGPSRGGKASLDARDAIDAYARHLFEESLRQGVTAVCVEPPSGNGVAGLAALVRMGDLDALSATTEGDVCLVIRIGVGRVGPVARHGEMKALRELLTSAREYRESWEEYEEQLEKYQKELKAGKTVKLKEGDKPKTEKKEDRPPPPPDQRRGRRPRPPRDDAHQRHETNDSADADATDADSPNELYAFETALPRCPQHPWIEVVCCCPEDHETDHECEHDHVDLPEIPDWLTLDVDPKAAPEKKDEKKVDELSKPDRPDRDPDQEILVRALKRELPVRFEVHRAADLVQALNLIEEFNLNAAISGGSGAFPLSRRLADMELPVLLNEFIPSASLDRTHARELRFDNAARLEEAGVRLVIGTGTDGGSPRTAYLSQNAAIAVGNGLSRDAALRGITIEAARLCGADDKIGSLEKGKLADVVIWKGHPLSADSVVEYVFIGGRQVYPPAP